MAAPSRIYALDLLRFVAALAVVLYHYTARPGSEFEALSQVTRFGYLGVPLFFMISGFVIVASAQNRSPVEFAISRSVRLYPAYWISIVITLAVVSGLGTADFGWLQVLANLTMLNDYVGLSDIDGVYWTLQAELKFYGCVFLLLAAGLFQKYKIWLGIWMAATITHLAFSQPFFMGWFISPGYSSFFIAGVAFFLLRERWDTYYATILIAALLVSSIYGFRQAPGFIDGATPRDSFIAVGILWALFALFGMVATDRLRAPPTGIIVALGGITYPLYLIHNRAGKAIIDRLTESVPEWAAVAAVTILMLLASFLLYEYAERRLATPLKAVLLGSLNRMRSLPRRVADGA